MVKILMFVLVSLCLAQVVPPVLPQGQEVQPIITIGPFDGGMNNIKSPYLLTMNELSDAQNVDFSTLGEARCRWGYDKIGTAFGDIILAVKGSLGKPTGALFDNGLLLVTMKSSDTVNTVGVSNVIGRSGKTKYAAFIGMPQIELWKNGFLSYIPILSTTTGGKNDSLNCIRYTSYISVSSSKKIGLPQCSCSVSSAAMEPLPQATLPIGVYYYSVTFRRDYTLNGKTYYEEGNSIIKKMTNVSASNGGWLQNVPTLSSQWQGTYDGYNGSWTRRVYRTLTNGSVLYYIGTIHNDSTKWVDTVTIANTNTYGPTYDEVINNNCLDSLMAGYFLRGFSVHNNRLFTLLEGTDNTGLAQATILRTIPFTNQTPLLFSSTRQSIIPGGRSTGSTGLISCGGRLYLYGLSGIQVIADPTSNVAELMQVTDLPIFGSNCIKCVENELVAMSTRGEVFTSGSGAMVPNVQIVDSSNQRWATSWDKVGSSLQHKTYSLSAIKPLQNIVLCASNDSVGAYMGFQRNGIAWSKFPIKAKNVVGENTTNKLFFIDTTINALCYWPSRTLNQKDYNGSDSAWVNWSITTGWMDFGSFDATKQIEKIRMNISLVDTLKIYVYWDGSSTINDSGTVYSQDTVVVTHKGDNYTWFPKRNNIGRYLKLKFQQRSSSRRKMVFREAKVYSTLIQR